MMHYLSDFDADTFKWKNEDVLLLVHKIRQFGKMREFQELLDHHFKEQSPNSESIENYVSINTDYIRAELGIPEEKKKIKVFYRITGLDECLVEADTPEEARGKAVDAFFNGDGDMFCTMLIDDVETVVPVAYEDENGETRDFDVGESEEGREELKNALVGSELWALVRSDVERSAKSMVAGIQMFFSKEDASKAMLKAFRGTRSIARNHDDLNTETWLSPVKCSISRKSGSKTYWNVTRMPQVIEGMDDNVSA